MNQISLDWDTLKGAYPKRPLTGALKAFMDGIPGTPCCVQMSHALSAAGSIIGPRSLRRANARITTPIGTRYYLLAVDEMKWFLEINFGIGDEISRDDDGGRRSLRDMKALLNGRTGILVFSNLMYGTHTELWDVDHLHQRDISETVFNAAKVLFWDVMITAVA
jgi:Type VI secretion system (T6SS), amidase effector protein 4